MATVHPEAAPAPRIGIALPVKMTLEGTGVTAKGISENMSETGILVVTSIEPQRGGGVDLEVGSFRARAELIWSRKLAEGEVRLGMKFTHLGREAQNFLSGFRTYLDDHGYRLRESIDESPTHQNHG